eukprot:Nk52_evm32s292 gene=Nk52_evmTU32s292
MGSKQSKGIRSKSSSRDVRRKEREVLQGGGALVQSSSSSGTFDTDSAFIKQKRSSGLGQHHSINKYGKKKEISLNVQKEFFIHSVLTGNAKVISEIICESSGDSLDRGSRGVLGGRRKAGMAQVGDSSLESLGSVEDGCCSLGGSWDHDQCQYHGANGDNSDNSNDSESDSPAISRRKKLARRKSRKQMQKYMYLRSSNFLNERFVYEGEGKIGKLASDGGLWTVEKIEQHQTSVYRPILFAMALEKDQISRILVESGDIDLNLYGMMMVSKLTMVPRKNSKSLSQGSGMAESVGSMAVKKSVSNISSSDRVTFPADSTDPNTKSESVNEEDLVLRMGSSDSGIKWDVDAPEKETEEAEEEEEWYEFQDLKQSRQRLFVDVCPLHYAVYMGHLSLTILLLQNGANVNLICDTAEERCTSLHLAVESCRDDICLVLLRYGANIDVKDAKGRTPKDLAAHLRFKKCFDVLEKAEQSGNRCTSC